MLSTDVLLEALCSISELMLRREEPFDQICFHDSIASPVFTNFLHYACELNHEQKKLLMDHFISKSRHLLKERMVGRQPIYANEYPELFEAENQFIDWYFHKRQNSLKKNCIIDTRELNKFDIKSVIKNEVKEKYFEFSFDLNFKKRDSMIFLKKITDQISFLVLFNIGIKRMFFSVEIGLNNPLALIDIGNLLARPQSMFDYNNTEDVKNGISVAFDFINIIEPLLYKKIGV